MPAAHNKIGANGFQTARKIVVLDIDPIQCLALCDLLTGLGYQAVPAYSLSDFTPILLKKSILVVLIDLDTVPMDNLTIKTLSVQNPGIYLLCLSSSRYHPGLKESICNHIYAFINKPINPDELNYLIGSIYKEAADPIRQS